jgi:hypothetical protein
VPSCPVCRKELSGPLWDERLHLECSDELVQVVLDMMESKRVQGRTIAETILSITETRMNTGLELPQLRLI